MKICLKENEFNPSLLYQSWCDEEKAKSMGYTIVEIDDAYRDCSFEDFDGFEFNLEKYNARKKQENTVSYEQLVISKIRERYTIDQELAILRQRDIKPTEFAEYNSYVEQCKTDAKEEVNGR